VIQQELHLQNIQIPFDIPKPGEKKKKKTPLLMDERPGIKPCPSRTGDRPSPLPCRISYLCSSLQQR